jgi:hypothetical protein
VVAKRNNTILHPFDALANKNLDLWHDVSMPKRSSRKAKRDDFQNALRVVEEAIDSSLGKNPAAVALGRQGGLKGGKARAKALTPSRREEIAQQAAQARWAKVKKGS